MNALRFAPVFWRTCQSRKYVFSRPKKPVMREFDRLSGEDSMPTEWLQITPGLSMAI